MKKLNIVLILIMSIYIQYGCHTKTKEEYRDGIKTSMTVFKHTPMPVYECKDTSVEKYSRYVEEMCSPYFGDHCDYLMDMNNGTFMVINADTTLNAYQIRTQIGVSSGDSLYNRVARRITQYAINTWKDINSIRVVLPRPEELKSLQVWKLLCTHESVHKNNILEEKYLQGVDNELPAYLREKKLFDTMDPEWNTSFYKAFTPFYEKYGFCDEMLEALYTVFDIHSLSKVEESSISGGLMFFIAMESKGIEKDEGKDQKKGMKEIINEMNVFLKSNGNVSYY